MILSWPFEKINYEVKLCTEVLTPLKTRMLANYFYLVSILSIGGSAQMSLISSASAAGCSFSFDQFDKASLMEVPFDILTPYYLSAKYLLVFSFLPVSYFFCRRILETF